MPATRRSARHAASADATPSPPAACAARVEATFALRCASANVCIFPFVTRNKTAPTQLFVGLATAIVLVVYLLSRFTPLPLLLQLLLAPVLALPLLPVLIPLEGMLLVLASRGRWHDHKMGRLRLLLERLDEFDALAVQELFSGIFDTRYRDLVIREAKRAGLHYSVACGRVPVFPAFLLNTGTLLLSRYPIIGSRTLVFREKAFYDYFVVNRGCSWMRLELPFGTQVDFFTCHLAPPLSEVSERVKLLEYCKCPQEAQLEELVAFMSACVSDRPRAARRIVLAADLNIDCGSLRYFKLLHALQELADMRDLFATTEEAEPPTVHVATRGDVPESEDEQEEEPSAAAQKRRSKSPIARPTSPATPSSRHTPSPTSPSSLGVAYNEWQHGHGNGRERFCATSHAPLHRVLPKEKLRWEPTFGQQLPPHLREHPALKRAHLETFLTHQTLLGSHTTHDFFLTNIDAVQIRVEPFLTRRAQRQLLAAAEGHGAEAEAEDRKKGEPPFTQLSDHCALVATLLVDMPAAKQ